MHILTYQNSQDDILVDGLCLIVCWPNAIVQIDLAGLGGASQLVYLMSSLIGELRIGVEGFVLRIGFTKIIK